MNDSEETTSKPARATGRSWAFRIWLVILMTVGALMGHRIAFSAFGHPKGQPRNVMYGFAGLIVLGALAGAVAAYTSARGKPT